MCVWYMIIFKDTCCGYPFEVNTTCFLIKNNFRYFFLIDIYCGCLFVANTMFVLLKKLSKKNAYLY